MDIRPAVRERARLITRGSALFAVAVGGAVLLGWQLDLMILKAAFSQASP
jgi:hypothetical protein